jgi:hypothetical protein
MAEIWSTFVYNFNKSLQYSKKVSSHFVSFMTQIFRFMKISQLPTAGNMQQAVFHFLSDFGPHDTNRNAPIFVMSLKVA